MGILTIDPARVMVRIVSPDIEKTAPLTDLLAGHTVNGQPVYKMGCHCYNCPGPDAGGCSYVVALDYAIDGGDWVTDGAWCDVLPLPLCPVVQAIATGAMTWADVFKRYWPDNHWQTVYRRYDIDDNAAATACNAYATWQRQAMTILVGNYHWGDKEETLSLADALDKGGIYKSGQRTCRHCLAAKTETCPYTVGTGYSMDGGTSWDIGTAAAGDAIPLPPCPIAQAVADGRTTWRKVNRATRTVWRKHWPK